MADTFKVGQKVMVTGMRDPGEIISGPHAGLAGDRWLVRKADGNVSLLAAKFLAPHDDKRDRVAEAIYGVLGVRKSFSDASPEYRGGYLRAADAVIAELDKSAKPLAEGDKIRILTSRYEGAKVVHGDVLTVKEADVYGDGWKFATDAPGSLYPTVWRFPLAGEGTGWERV